MINSFHDADALALRARTVIPGGINSSNRRVGRPLAISRAEGAYLWDLSGERFTDYHCAGGPILLGHCHKRVDAAAASAGRQLDLIGLNCTENEVLLAERIVDILPSAECVLLTTSGSEATYHAIRLARAVTGRQLLLKFEGCYHGWHDAVAASLTPTRDELGAPAPMSAGSLSSTISLTAVAPYNDLLAVEEFFNAHGADTAAIIVEPIAHNVGALLPDPGFLSGLRELCDKHGSVLIFDEVITGIRHQIGGYQSICGVRPDITTLGKSLGNGYPIGAVAGPRSLMHRFTTHEAGDVLFAGTYNAHPQAVVAALSTLDILTEEPVHESINRLGDAARLGLTVLYAEFGIPAVVTGFGSIFVTYFMDPPCRTYSDLLRSNEEMFCRHRMELLSRGVIQMPIHLKRNHLTYAHTPLDIDDLLERSRDALIELLKPENSRRRALGGSKR